MGRLRGALPVVFATGLLVAGGCDSGSSALFGDTSGDGGEGGGGEMGKGASSNAGNPSAASANAGSSNGATSNAGSANAGNSNGGAPDPGTGGMLNEGGVINPGGAGESAGGDSSSAGETGSAGAPGTAGETGQAGQTGEGGAGHICDHVALSVEPRRSNVVLMMDRSGSMFDLNSNPWNAVRDAALPVIQSHADELDLGFLAMTGEQGTCPLFDQVAVAPDNYAAIAAKYGSLVKPTKGESPHALALTTAKAMLDAASGSGESFALLVIDGEPDYCNDGNSLCPYDTVVARIQSLQAQGITTLVGGLPMKSVVVGDAARYLAALQSYANAGVGLPAATIGDTTTNIYYQCTGVTEWNQEFAATGKPALQAIGSYSNSPGAAPYTAIDTTSAKTLTASFDALLSRAKSCVFDIDTFAIVPQQASLGTVKVDGKAIPFSNSDGWRLSGARAIELTGSACVDWRTPGDKPVSVSFPCAAISE